MHFRRSQHSLQWSKVLSPTEDHTANTAPTRAKPLPYLNGGNPNKSHTLSGDTCQSSPYMGVAPTQTLSSFDASPSKVYKDKYF